MPDPTAFHVTLTWTSRAQFLVSFEDLEDRIPLLVDEPPPAGDGHGPSAVSLLAAAVGHSLGASLLRCLRTAGTTVSGLTARVTVEIAPDRENRARVERLRVELAPQLAVGDAAHLARCRQMLDALSVIASSLRRGIPLDVTVRPLPGPG